MSPASLVARFLVLAFAVPFLWSCGDGPAEFGDDVLAEIHLDVVSGDAQEGAAGEELAQPLVVEVTDDQGRPMPRQVVTFRVVEGGGSMFAGAALATGRGLAADWWTLGPSGAQVVEVRSVAPDGQRFVHARFVASIIGEPPPPPPPPTDEDADADGYSVAQGDCDDADPAINPGAEDRPDANFLDTNCDGIDGDIDLSVFVSTAGADAASCGSMAAPCRSIDAALTMAEAAVLRDVLVEQGSYAESVILRDGVNLYGAYGPGFISRDPINHRTTITGGSGLWISPVQGAGGVEAVTLLASIILKPTEVADLTIEGMSAVGAVDGRGRNSYAVYVQYSTGGVLTITRNRIVGGFGAGGIAGGPGRDARQTPAISGADGGNGAQVSLCDDELSGSGGAGGGIGFVMGGNGGDGGTRDGDCASGDFFATAGLAGSDAATASATLGGGGAGGAPCSAGQDGQPGIQGEDGPDGLGGTSDGTSGVPWISANGTDGALGVDGFGGGGGGGAGGCDAGTESYGAGGGGGGEGGARGASAGMGGGGGGASIGIFVEQTEAVIQGNVIVRGNGGQGGAGGNGGVGQPGGTGGQGGLRSSPSDGPGGGGGSGGDGGDAGAGGGGAGGSSIGIAFGTESSSARVSGNNVFGGLPGSGGDGGSAGGGNGSQGLLMDLAFF